MVNLGLAGNVAARLETYSATMRDIRGLQAQLDTLALKAEGQLRDLREAVKSVHEDMGIDFLFRSKG